MNQDFSGIVSAALFSRWWIFLLKVYGE